MAAAFRSISFTTYAARTNTTVSAPAGIQNDDLLLAIIQVGATGTAPTPTPPAGFSLIAGFPASVTDGSGFNGKVYAWYKTASGESGSYTITHAAANSGGLMICYSGAFVGSPAATVATGFGTTPTATGLTTSEDNDLVVYLDAIWQNYLGTASPPAGSTPTFTERMDDTTTLFYVADGNLAVAGATGNKSHSVNNMAGDPWMAFLFDIKAFAFAVPTGGWNPILTQANSLKTLGAR